MHMAFKRYIALLYFYYVSTEQPEEFYLIAIILKRGNITPNSFVPK